MGLLAAIITKWNAKYSNDLHLHLCILHCTVLQRPVMMKAQWWHILLADPAAPLLVKCNLQRHTCLKKSAYLSAFNLSVLMIYCFFSQPFGALRLLDRMLNCSKWTWHICSNTQDRITLHTSVSHKTPQRTRMLSEHVYHPQCREYAWCVCVCVRACMCVWSMVCLRAGRRGHGHKSVQL